MNTSNVDKLINEIISEPHTAAGVNKQDFCKVWPTVKQGLELLAKLLPKAAIIIVIIIDLGDRYCKG